MRSKPTLAAALLVTLLAGCRSVPPWQNEPIGNEVNLNFLFRDNQIEMNSIRLGGGTGRFLLGTAAPRTVIDPSIASRTPVLTYGERDSVRVQPVVIPLGGMADAIVAADADHHQAVTIDYRAGLVNWQKDGIHTGHMTLYSYPVEPAIEVLVDGRHVAAVVDTASPDTLVLPSATAARRQARVQVAGTDFGSIDVRLADVSGARIGNRLLSRFLVTVDYGRRTVGLWRDPRIPLR